MEQHLLQYNYTSLSDVMDKLNKAWDDAAASIGNFLETTLQAENKEETQFHTELDKKQLALQKEELVMLNFCISIL